MHSVYIFQYSIVSIGGKSKRTVSAEIAFDESYLALAETSPTAFSSRQVSPVQDIASIITGVHRDWSDSRVSSLFPPSRSTNK